MRKPNTGGLLQRVKCWLLPHPEAQESLPPFMPNSGTAVAGFVQRAMADVDIMKSSNMTRPLAVLMPPAVAAATPLRTIPLFLVTSTVEPVEPAEVEIIHNARAVPKLHLVHNADYVAMAATSVPAFMLAARLTSVAHLNTAAGRKPHTPPQRLSAKTPNRPTTKAYVRPTTVVASKIQKCFVRPQAAGQAIVVSVPKPAKRRPH